MHKNQIAKETEKQAEKQAEEKENKRKNDLRNFNKRLIKLETGYVDRKLLYEYFGYRTPTEMASKLVKSNKEDNINLVASIQENLNKLIEDYHNTADESVMIEKLKKMKFTVEEFLDFNEQYQERQGLKILTPQQMLSRLPVPLAQLKAENNSEKHKNEIRQQLYSLYRSKKLSKTIYNNLINAI